MKVKKLIEILQNHEDDAEIFVSVDEEFNHVKQIWGVLSTTEDDNKEKLIIVPNDFDDYEI